LRNKEGLE